MTRNVIAWTFVCIAAVLVIAPLVWWWQNPAVTQMQMFQAWWPIYAVAVVMILVATWMRGADDA